MADPIDTRAFEAMQYAAPDLTAVDISMEKEGFTAFGVPYYFEKDLLTSDELIRKRDEKNQQEALRSFDDFIGLLPSQLNRSISELEVSKLEDLWIKGGKPRISIYEDHEEGWLKEPGRAFFSSMSVEGSAEQHVDVIGIYSSNLLENFMAEISHSMKYALKEGESKESWIKRREKLDERSLEQRSTFGKAVYGKSFTPDSGRSFKQSFPTELDYGITFGIDTVGGKEVVVDEHGKIYPEMEVPQYTHIETEGGVGRSRVMKWKRPEIKYAIFDPETRLGLGGEKLPEEFEAHKVVEDSLWGVWGDIFRQVYGEEF